MVLARVSSRVKEQRLLPKSYHVATLDYDAQTIFDGSLAFVRGLTRTAECVMTDDGARRRHRRY